MLLFYDDGDDDGAKSFLRSL